MSRIAILGGGASGVLLALHLLRGGRDEPEVVIVERGAELGAGAAYATRHPDHLLNVRAANMSAIAGDPDHFLAWLGARDELSQGPESFAPRRLYAAYLADLVAPLLAAHRLRQVRAEAVGLGVDRDGVTVECSDGAGLGLPPLRADHAVVATGNEGPSLPPEPWRHTGWGDAGPCRVAPDAPVVVVGTGLTMVDRVVWLIHDGHHGAITAVSRHGLIPLPHRVGLRPASLAAEEVPFGAPLPALAAWLRDRAQAAERDGGDWRSAVDALRPHTQALWRSLPQSERRRFLRHLWPFWNVHRHRIAPPAAEKLDEAGRRGQLRVLAGRVTGFAPGSGGVTVSVEHRRGGATEQLDAAAVFECRGRSQDLRRTDNPLLRALLDSGLGRPDPLGLGLDVGEDCALIDTSGRASDQLFALGPATAGTFWEITAVPDIRAQAARLADAMTSLQPGASNPPALLPAGCP